MFSLGAAMTSAAAGRATVPRWQPEDFAFKSGEQASNPFLVAFTAKVMGPDGRSFELPGFFDGDGTWKIRVSPTVEGEWSLVTKSDLKELDGKKAGFTCVKNEGPNAHGVLRVDSEHRHHFIFADGTRFFMQGYEYDWLWALDMDKPGVPLVKQSLDLLSRHGFNYIILNSYAHDTGWRKGKTGPDDYGPPLLYPWAGNNELPDQSRMNPAYWRHYDEVIAAMNERGIQAHMFIKVYNKSVKWPAHDSDEEKLFFRWLVARYAAYPNIIWDFSKEAHYERDLAYKQRWLKWLRDYDPYHHLTTVHDDDKANDSGAFDDLTDFRADQQHGKFHETILRQRERRAWPVANVESDYECGPGGLNDKTYGQVTTPERTVATLWDIQMAGGYTVYYYTYTAWDVVRPLDVPTGYAYLKHFGDFWRATDYWNLEPSDNLVNSGRCIALPGREYVVYQNQARPFTLEIAGAASPLAGAWFNPHTGRRTAAGTFANGKASITPPADWGGAPLVLHLRGHHEGIIEPPQARAPQPTPALPAHLDSAAAPAEGTPVVPGNTIATMGEAPASKYGTLTRVKVDGQPFGEAVRCEISTRPGHPWNIQLLFPTTRRVEKGEVLRARFFARTVATKTGSGAGHVTAIFQDGGTPYAKSLMSDFDVGREWTEFQIPFKAHDTYDAGKATAGFHLGAQEQTIEIADFSVKTFGKESDIKRLPRTKTSYDGQAADASWRTAADARIEKIRKGDLTVSVVDASGQPVSGAKVTVAMKRHAFGWGSAVTVKGILRQDADGDKYRDVIEKNFTRVVFENDLKWPGWDNQATHEKILQAAEWLRERHIEIRGHNLIWPSWKNTPHDLQELKDKPDALRQRINSHIADEVGTMKGRIVDWDVINEPCNNNDVMKILGDNEMIAWFKAARSCDPDVKLTLNDFSILSAGGMDKSHQDHFEKIARLLKDGGAPITGLGMQSHFSGTLTPPERMLSILDRFAALGLDISITEHDIDTTDEALQADVTRDFLTAVFSHPSVVSILTWGFWEKSHWRPNAAYYRGDWSITLAGQVWLDLVTKKWWTHETLETAADGTAHTRGFLGDYTITVTRNGTTKTLTTQLPKAGVKVEIRL